MNGADIIEIHEWHPLTRFSLTHPFFFVNSNTLIYTWIALAVLMLFAFITRVMLSRRSSTARFLILSLVRSFVDMTQQALGHFSYNHTVFITALFLFIFLCNTVALIPYVQEATRDLNTTFALGIISFIYVQWYAIKTHGIVEYIKEYTSPIFLMAPLHLISKISTVISMSFRLFGNIFGSSIILHIYTMLQEQSIIFQLIGLAGLNVLMTAFFILFEGFLQAFEFTMLALTYLGIAVTHDEIAKETAHA